MIAQITSPCVDQYHHLADFIENLEDLVKSLTGNILVHFVTNVLS